MSFAAMCEIFISCHLLLALSSLVAGRFSLRATGKLRLHRLLFLACLFSPVIAQAFKPAARPLFLEWVANDTWRAQAKALPDTNEHREQSPKPSLTKTSHMAIKAIDWRFLGILLFLSGITWKAGRVARDIRRINRVVQRSFAYRSCRSLRIMVSNDCVIPFSVKLMRHAYIVLPITMLSSTIDTKIAIAHEGQHHRQGDCTFAYLFEMINIIFFGNPGLRRWKRVLSELQEFSCDETLVGHRLVAPHDYGHCLLKVAQTASLSSEPSWREFACAVGMAQGRDDTSMLKRRILMLSSYQTQAPRRMLFRLGMSGLFMTLPFGIAYAARGTLSPAIPTVIDASTLDPKWQGIAEHEIKDAVAQHGAKSGVIAIAEAQSGRIVAFAETRRDGSSETWAERVFAPASTIKPFVAAAAIEAGVATALQQYDCRQPYVIGAHKFTNYNSSFTDVSMTEAIAKSVNICLIKMAQDLGSEPLKQSLSRFGFDVRNQDNQGDDESLQLAKLALGETTPVTISSLLKAYTILANKGRLPNQANAISATTAESVTKMLVEAVTHGTGSKASLPGVSIAGKTGTLASNTKPKNQRLALFAGYIPAEQPRFIAFVAIETSASKGANQASGGALAAPIFREVFRQGLKDAKL